MSIIRKIAVGPDYKESAMHYVVGQNILDGTWVIHLIELNEEGGLDIWIESQNGEVLRWKRFTVTMPIFIEYNINF